MLALSFALASPSLARLHQEGFAWPSSAQPARQPASKAQPASSIAGWLGLGWLGLGLASCSLGFRLEFGWISAVVWLRLDFGLILVWLDLDLDFDLDFGLDFLWIWSGFGLDVTLSRTFRRISVHSTLS